MKKSYLMSVFLAALVFIFSLQLFRVFMATVMWNLGFYLGGPYQLALFGLAVFAMAFAAAPLCRIMGERKLLVLTVAGIAAVRIGVQFVRDPLALTALSTLGVIFFEWFLPLAYHSVRDFDTEPVVPMAAAAFPLAMLIDTGSRTLLLSYDIVWHRHLSWGVVVIGSAACLILLLWREIRGAEPTGPARAPQQASLPLIALGPWLYLSMAVFQNPQAVMGIAGSGDVAAHCAVNALNASGIILCPLMAVWPARRSLILSLAPAGLLTMSLYVMVNVPGCSWFWTIAGGSAMWVLAGFIFAGKHIQTGRTAAMRRSGAAVFLGFLLLLVSVFIHAQFKVFGVTVVAAGMLFLLSIFFSSDERAETRGGLNRGILRFSTAAAGLAMIVVTLWAVSSPLPAAEIPAEKKHFVRIVTYNIHQCFNADYRVDLEGIAETIAALEPDIVGLQEVNRAQVVNGMTDCLGLISVKLNMPYVFGGNHNDRQYGNAVLSRYPITSHENRHFTHNSTEVRGVLHAVVETPLGALNVFVTHLDHISGPENVRKEQAREVVDFWGGKGQSVIMGDLNAEPDTSEMSVLYGSGLADSLAEMNLKYEKTFWEGFGETSQHLDYVFHTKELKTIKVQVVQSRASDHMPVMVDFKR